MSPQPKVSTTTKAPLLPPTGTRRIWLLPSQKARLTVVLCRTLLTICLAHAVYLYDKNNNNNNNNQWLCLAAFVTLVVGLLVGSQGPRWSLWFRLWGVGPPVQLFYRHTHVAPGYELVADAFQATLAQGRETSIQFAVYVKGELVVDLAGSTVQKSSGTINTKPVGHDKEHQLHFDSHCYSTVWSCSKVVTSIVVAWLVDQGYLSYDTKIKEYWPEFTGGGKENVTVEQLLHHHAGLSAPIPYTLQLQDLFPENIAKGQVSTMFESMSCKYPPQWTQAMSYHGMTRGWILNEIVRRVDPHQRTIGVILKQQFTDVLNISQECYLGLPPELCDPTTNPNLRLMDPLPSYLWVLFNKLCRLLHLPTTAEWKFSIIFTTFVLYMKVHWKRASDFYNPHSLPGYSFYRQADYLRGETPSANVQASARALATLANAMATSDARVFHQSSNIMEQAAENEQTRFLMPGYKCTFNNGGFCVMTNHIDFDIDSDNIKSHIPTVPGAPFAWGWWGFNGSLMAFHPKGDFAVAFQPTAFNELDPYERVQLMTKAVMQCARTLHGPEFGAACY